VLIRDRLAAPIRTLSKVPALVMFLVLIGQVMGYDIINRQAIAPLGVVRVVVLIGCICMAVLVVALASVIQQKQLQPLDANPKEPSKLIIYSANYRAIEGGGNTYDVTEFLRKIISGDSLVFDIENHNFVIGDQNFVPVDPFSGKVKRLRVTYSFRGDPSITTERSEHERLVLPEDPEAEKAKRLCLEENRKRTEFQQEYAIAAGRVKQLEGMIEGLKKRLLPDSQYPIPDLRLKVVAMVSELQGFLGAHGQEPELTKLPGETDMHFMNRARDVLMPWNAKFLGNYRVTFRDSVPRLRDELLSRTGIYDCQLNNFIEQADKDPNGNVRAVQGIVNRLWDLALAINV